jgi:hypothetical protein
MGRRVQNAPHAPTPKDMNLCHLEWLIGAPVADPEMVVYEVLPYAPAQADRIIEHLCRLASLDVVQAGDDPVRAERVRQASQLIVDAAGAREAMLDLQAIERKIGRSPWRERLMELRHDRSRFAPRSATGARASHCAGHSVISAWLAAPAAAGCITCATTRWCGAERSTGRWRLGYCNGMPGEETGTIASSSSRALAARTRS